MSSHILPWADPIDPVAIGERRVPTS